LTFIAWGVSEKSAGKTPLFIAQKTAGETPLDSIEMFLLPGNPQHKFFYPTASSITKIQIDSAKYRKSEECLDYFLFSLLFIK
jgi:hypothetical protein